MTFFFNFFFILPRRPLYPPLLQIIVDFSFSFHTKHFYINPKNGEKFDDLK